MPGSCEVVFRMYDGYAVFLSRGLICSDVLWDVVLAKPLVSNKAMEVVKHDWNCCEAAI